ncbi:MAG: polyribonucleotide nucleotidyltransferase [Planctomycetota bacterium]|jgi:polyribonucleotide nucleotidyltransferase|nr:polyribonucleotide nucleotidyltransferase [Planctomycetota bacterium]
MEELKLNEVAVEREIAGRTLRISTGLVAKQAAGSCVVRYGDTVVLSAVAMGDQVESDDDFFPLTVDYREKTYAAGKFPGGFFKREKAPSTHETLTMRLTDRPLRPLFPDGFNYEVIVQSLVMSSDLQNPGDILSIVGASTACSLSPLPFKGPVGAVRIGLVDGQLVVNPTETQLRHTELNLTIAGTADSITMVEAGANNLSEEKMLEALYLGHAQIKIICEMIKELMTKAGKPKMEFIPPAPPASLDAARALGYERIKTAMQTPFKQARAKAYSAARKELIAEIAKPDAPGFEEKNVKKAVDLIRAEVVRALIKQNARVDGRDLYTVRPIDARVDVLPRTHGSSLFTRGETQVLVAITLGSILDAQKVDGLHEPHDQQWFVHYQAPGFSVGEAKRPGNPGRRDIGHGMLAQRALQAVMPHGKNGFAYTIRAVSEVLEMNGSSSMATVCACTLALMDAGVPIAAPVAGIAMGLLQDAGEKPVIITDILGDEDHYGDMDFKVCGTASGITALQMDIKIDGIDPETMRAALKQSRAGLDHILGKISACLPAPRTEINNRAPRLEMVKVPSSFLGKIIGKGGETIRSLQDETKSEINIEEVGDYGEVTICAPNGEMLKLAVDRIKALCEVPEVGRTYTGKVTGVREFGCFVEILPSTEGMCHISELTDGAGFVKNVEDIVKIGDVISVKVVDIEGEGKLRLSRKAVILEERGEVYTPPPPRAPRPPRRDGPRR